MLTLDTVSKTYRVGTFGGKAIEAVSHVTFDVRPGEVVSLIGESGSGKTTVGRMILRLTPVTSGAITLDGQDVSRLGGGALRGYYTRSRASSRTRSAPTTPSSRPTASRARPRAYLSA